MRHYIKDEKGNITGAKFIGTPFSITAKNITSKLTGTWDTKLITVFRDDVRIGEYNRNYHSQGVAVDTFYPFQHNGEWYALYSKDYTATRVAKLTDKFKDWCGQERDSWGFCPAEFYVPRANVFEMKKNGAASEFAYRTYDNEYKDEEELLDQFYDKETDTLDNDGGKLMTTTFIGREYLPYGFMSGCVWGDDSSWKLRFIDLTQIDQKILTITDKFGYWELPDTLPLHKCIEVDAFHKDPRKSWVKLTGSQSFSLYHDKFEKEL